MRRAIILAAVLVAGCSPAKGPGAEERYRIVERNGGSPQDLCREASAVARAYLDDRNEQQYQTWHLTELGQCARAQLERG